MMRNPFFALALTAALAAFPAAARAQDAARPDTARAPGREHAEAHPKVGHGRMLGPVGWMIAHREMLELTDDQVRRLEAIRTNYEQKNRAHLEQIRANREAARKEATAVLTPAQRERIKEQMKERRREWRGRRHGEADRSGAGGA
jgi:Spy/CpxP family protein refolding chaperone